MQMEMILNQGSVHLLYACVFVLLFCKSIDSEVKIDGSRIFF